MTSRASLPLAIAALGLAAVLGFDGGRVGVAGLRAAWDSAQVSQSRPFSIEQVMSSPFPSELVASPAGARVAWVFNSRGSRSIWVADGPAWTGRELLQVGEPDDGQDVTSLAFTPDGEGIAYVRGGGTNRAGETPNPMSDPRGVEQAVWIVGVRDGQARRLAQGSTPTVSPKGDRVVFSRGSALWSVPLDPAAELKAEKLFEARGQARGARFSPDGRRVVFVSGRGTHSFIGVYDVERQTITWLDPSVDNDSSPAWSPDGRFIAFIREPVRRDVWPFHAAREGQPWSIRVADAATGAGREVWRAAGGPGSLYSRTVSDQQVWWAAGNTLVFPWEREGWRLLYALPLQSSDLESSAEGTGHDPNAGRGSAAAKLLTPGRFEVEYVALSPDGRSVVYNSNQDDIDRRHLWRVPVDGSGAPRALTSGTTIEWSPTPVADGRSIALFRADARMPAHPALLDATGQVRQLAPGSLPKDFPLAALVEPEAVTLSASDGMAIPAQLFLPAGIRPDERRPAAIFFHGGSRRQMLLGWHYGSYYHHTYAFNQYLAGRGFVVLSVNYRSGTGYGLEFREASNYGAAGASEFHDVVGAGLYLRNRADVDPARIGVWGGSYGGYLTALGLARAPELFAAGVDIHGVHDWNVVIRNFAPGYDPQRQAETARVAFQSSPMAHLDGWKAPVLVVHGDDDRNVPFSETGDLVEQLRNRGVHVEQLIFPDEVHSFLRHENWLRTFRASADFFERFLKRPAPAAPTTAGR